jgi:hypothetical protein
MTQPTQVKRAAILRVRTIGARWGAWFLSRAAARDGRRRLAVPRDARERRRGCQPRAAERLR